MFTITSAVAFILLIALSISVVGVLLHRRRVGASDRSMNELGVVSKQWLTIHRTESL
jgi:hypothetical protein